MIFFPTNQLKRIVLKLSDWKWIAFIGDKINLTTMPVLIYFHFHRNVQCVSLFLDFLMTWLGLNSYYIMKTSNFLNITNSVDWSKTQYLQKLSFRENKTRRDKSAVLYVTILFSLCSLSTVVDIFFFNAYSRTNNSFLTNSQIRNWMSCSAHIFFQFPIYSRFTCTTYKSLLFFHSFI